MKTLKDFISSQKVEETQPVVEEQVVADPTLELQTALEISNLIEAKGDAPHDMPAVLIMRRKSIRQMSNGQKVALYYVDKLDKYVTIPYGENTWFTTMESMEPIADDVIVQLNNIVENDCTKNVRFENGESTKVNVRTAKTVLKVYESLNEENKSRIRYAGNSKEHFGKVVDFAWKHTKG